MKRGFFITAAAFGLTLAIIVGLRLEQASLAVIVGVLCGIAAGLPVSGALLYLLWRERQERLQAEQRHWKGTQRPAAPMAPPVIVLNAGHGRGANVMPQGYALGPAQPREFVIVGEEDSPSFGRHSP